MKKNLKKIIKIVTEDVKHKDRMLKALQEELEDVQVMRKIEENNTKKK